MSKLKFRAKILIPTGLLLTALLVGTLTFTIIQFSNFNEYLLERRLETATIGLRTFADDTRRLVIEVGLKIAYDDRLVQALLNDDRQQIMRVGNQLVAEHGVTYITVAGADTLVRARTDEPDNFGDAFRTRSLLEALEGIVSVSYTPVGARQIPIRSSLPIFHDGEIIGIVVVGYALDTPKAVESLKERFGAEFTVFVGTERVSSTLLNAQGQSVVGTHMDNPEVLQRVFNNREEFSTNINLFGEKAGDYNQAIVMTLEH